MKAGPVFSIFHCEKIYKTVTASVSSSCTINSTNSDQEVRYFNSYTLDLLDFIYSLHKGRVVKIKIHPKPDPYEKEAKCLWLKTRSGGGIRDPSN